MSAFGVVSEGTKGKISGQHSKDKQKQRLRTGLCFQSSVESTAESDDSVSVLWQAFAWCERICGTGFVFRASGDEMLAGGSLLRVAKARG